MWSTGEGNGKPLQYSFLENPMNRMKSEFLAESKSFCKNIKQVEGKVEGKEKLSWESSSCGSLN